MSIGGKFLPMMALCALTPLAQTRAHFDRKIDVGFVDSRTLVAEGPYDPSERKSRIEIQLMVIEKTAFKAPEKREAEDLRRLEAFWSHFFLLRPGNVLGVADVRDSARGRDAMVQWQPGSNDSKVKSLYMVGSDESYICVFEVERDILDSTETMNNLLTSAVDVSGNALDIRNISYSIYPATRPRGIVGVGGAIFGEDPNDVDIITDNRVGHEFGLTGVVTSSKRAYLVFTIGKKLFKTEKR